MVRADSSTGRATDSLSVGSRFDSESAHRSTRGLAVQQVDALGWRATLCSGPPLDVRAAIRRSTPLHGDLDHLASPVADDPASKIPPSVPAASPRLRLPCRLHRPPSGVVQWQGDAYPGPRKARGPSY